MDVVGSEAEAGITEKKDCNDPYQVLEEDRGRSGKDNVGVGVGVGVMRG